jgi:two-component system, chemotaxis family, protein-glutamate methylesterase/glutaminase
MPAIIAIGTSSGGYAALCALLGALPASFPAPILVVQHIGAHRTQLAEKLAEVCALPVAWAGDGLPLQRGVHVAPADRHLLVVQDRIELTRGPRENFARPAIDPLFRSIAAYGARAIGVVLTGRLNDGTAGLYEIKRHGGIAVVQDPAGAEYPEMPRSALSHVEVDHCVDLDRIAPLLITLAARIAAADTGRDTMELRPPTPGAATALANVSAFVCPECGGATRRIDLGDLATFACHIGHRFTAESLAEGLRASLNLKVEFVAQALHEYAAMCDDMARKQAGSADREAWLAARDQAHQRFALLRSLFDSTWHEPLERAPGAARRAGG